MRNSCHLSCFELKILTEVLKGNHPLIKLVVPSQLLDLKKKKKSSPSMGSPMHDALFAGLWILLPQTYSYPCNLYGDGKREASSIRWMQHCCIATETWTEPWMLSDVKIISNLLFNQGINIWSCIVLAWSPLFKCFEIFKADISLSHVFGVIFVLWCIYTLQ